MGASANTSLSVNYQNKQVDDSTMYGYTPDMVDIDTRTLDRGRYFTDTEDHHAANICLIGATMAETLFPGVDPLGHVLRAANQEFTVIGTFERIGSVLGQDQDNFFIIPLTTFLKFRGRSNSCLLYTSRCV